MIVKSDKIVAEGINRVTSGNDSTAHAEMIAIREACKNLDTFQLNGCSTYTSCKPCSMCLGAIYWTRPDKVTFGASKEVAAKANFDDHFIYEEMELDFDKRHIVFESILRNEANSVFEAWKLKADKTEY